MALPFPTERLTLGLLAAGLLVAVLASFTIGRYPVPLAWPGSWTPEMETVLLRIRFPRILAALEVGAALAGSGAAFQGMFRNPMVSPDILGVSPGASFGAALGILWSWSTLGVQAAAFVFGLAAVTSTILIGLWHGRRGDVRLVMILAGVIIGPVFTAFLSLVKVAADPSNTLPAITYWLMGSLASINNADALGVALPISVGLGGLLLLRWKLNLLSFGDEEAQAMGVNVGLIRLLVIGCATLATASAVSISGVIALVGLVVPYLGRLLVGPDHRALLPACILLGGLYLLVVDDFARTMLPGEIPLGILTALIGAPVFLSLLLKSSKAWA